VYIEQLVLFEYKLLKPIGFQIMHLGYMLCSVQIERVFFMHINITMLNIFNLFIKLSYVTLNILYASLSNKIILCKSYLMQINASS